jgi:hypothetical protein
MGSTKAAPRAMSSLRNFAIDLIRARGWTGVPAANRRCAAHRLEVLALLGV